MINQKKVIAIIPAREGSKRLPGKNAMIFAGKPLIAWSIEEALKAKNIDRIIVSTNCNKIAEIAREYGAEVPFIRPDSLATDEAKTSDVIYHALCSVGAMESGYEYMILLQPTSPLRLALDIDNAVSLFVKKNALSVVSISEIDHPIEWCHQIGDDLSMDNFYSQMAQEKRSQEFAKAFRLNGAIYITGTDLFLKSSQLLHPSGTYGYIMPGARSLDIDSYDQFKLAEFIKVNGSYD